MLSRTDDVAFLMKRHIFHQKKVFHCAAVRNRPIFGLWKIGHDENTMYGHVSDYVPSLKLTVMMLFMIHNTLIVMRLAESLLVKSKGILDHSVYG